MQQEIGELKWLLEEKNTLNKKRFIYATMVSGLQRGFILHLHSFRLLCNFEKNSLHFVSFSYGFILQDEIRIKFLRKPDTMVAEIHRYIRK